MQCSPANPAQAGEEAVGLAEFQDHFFRTHFILNSCNFLMWCLYVRMHRFLPEKSSKAYTKIVWNPGRKRRVREAPSPKFLYEYDRTLRSEFISDWTSLSDFPLEIRSDLIYDQLSDRILFPIGFPVGFLFTFRSDPIVFHQNFRSEILSEFWAGKPF